MREQLPAIIVFSPFFAALLCPFCAALSKKLAQFTAAFFTGISLVLSIVMLFLIDKQGEAVYWFGGWVPPYGIEFSVDSLSVSLRK